MNNQRTMVLFIAASFLVIIGFKYSAEPSGTDPTSAKINLADIHQLIRGFGAANILPWRTDMTQSDIDKAFGTAEG